MRSGSWRHLGVVEQQQVTRLGEGVAAGPGDRVELGERGVPLGGEGVAHVDAQRSQVGERFGVGVDAAWPGRRVAVDLVAHREGRGVTEHDVRVRHLRADQAEPGTEGEVVDEHGVGAHPLDEVVHLPRHADGVPEQVVPPRAGLEGERRHGALAGGREEAPERVVLPRGLFLGADHARVRAPAELEVLALVAETADHRVGGGAGGDDDALPLVTPRRGQGGQRVEVRRVVGADDEQGHGVAAILPGPTASLEAMAP